MIRFHQTTQTFFVEEVLAYELAGEGPYILAQIEKRDASTHGVKARLSEITGVPISHIRHAGFKDAAATAVQWLSWPEQFQLRSAADGEGFSIRNLTKHNNTLAVGHVRANRFRLLLDAEEDPDLAAWPALTAPFANYYGPQRFGRFLADPEWFPAQLKRNHRNKNTISLLQSYLFNSYLRERIHADKATPLEGDIWMRAGGKRWFQSPLDEDIQRRWLAGELSPSGPMYGYKVQLNDRERHFLDRWDRSPEDFRRWGKFAKGTRRALFAHPTDVSLSRADGDQWELCFQLPAGSYATVYLAQAFQPALTLNEFQVWPNFTRPVTLLGNQCNADS